MSLRRLTRKRDDVRLRGWENSTMLFAPIHPAPAPVEAYALRMPFKAAATWEMKVNMTLETGGNTVTVLSNLSYAVKQIDSQGNALIESKNTGTTISMSGDSTVDERPQTKLAWFTAAGMLLRWQAAPEKATEAALFAALAQFVAPPDAVNVGEGWSAQYTPGTNGLDSNVRVSYNLESVANNNARVRVDFKEMGENGMTATGAWTINASTGVPMKFEGSSTNFLGQVGNKATVTIQRVE
ncbi:MAG: hypothetical protein KF812_02050 [Fimbriimonadaceae bacterium]|nr:hypothetical protein [Fimbriimonadaceae bacterium]